MEYLWQSISMRCLWNEVRSVQYRKLRSCLYYFFLENLKIKVRKLWLRENFMLSKKKILLDIISFCKRERLYMYHDHHLILYFIFPSFHLHAIKKKIFAVSLYVAHKKTGFIDKAIKEWRSHIYHRT